jgi:hypothetical protein
MARDAPMRRGKKKELHASMTIPRPAKTKPHLAFTETTCIAQGKTIVIPMPTAEPLIAAMVGLPQWWIARDTRRPLLKEEIVSYESFWYAERERLMDLCGQLCVLYE